MIKLFRFAGFVFSICFLIAMSPLLGESSEEYNKKFVTFLDVSGPKIKVTSIDELLRLLEPLLVDLNRKRSLESGVNRLKIEESILCYESDKWFFEELKSVLPDFTNKEKLKHLYDIACSSPRYHYVMVKLIADYPEVKAMVKVFSEARAAEMAPKRIRLTE